MKTICPDGHGLELAYVSKIVSKLAFFHGSIWEFYHLVDSMILLMKIISYGNRMQYYVGNPRKGVLFVLRNIHSKN